jgi:hypothetical protein
MANDPALVQSYLALEKIALAKMDDAEKVQWFQSRAMSAEQANAQLELEAQIGTIIKEFPAVDADDVKGLKTENEIRVVAQKLQAKADKNKALGRTEVEDAVRDALKLKDEDIAEMQKAYGKPRQSSAGDVTGSQSQTVGEAKGVGIGAQEEEIKMGGMEAVSKFAERGLRRAGLIQ